jgi:hypothetical protein
MFFETGCIDAYGFPKRSAAVTVCAEDDLTKALTVRCRDVSGPVLNALRHAMYMDVPVLGVKDVTFLRTDGPLEKELVANRIGLLPIRALRMPPAGAVPSTGHDDVAAVFEINVAATEGRYRTVWSTDARCIAGAAEIVHYRSPAEKAAAYLDKGYHLSGLHGVHGPQSLHATFTVVLDTARGGRARDTEDCHAPWSRIAPAMRNDAGDEWTYEGNGGVDIRYAMVVSLARLTLLSQRLLDSLPARSGRVECAV